MMSYYKKSSYSGDPRWLIAKFGNCKECGINIAGKRAFYYPAHKECFCEKCGEKHSNDFNSCRQDEDFMNSQFSY